MAEGVVIGKTAEGEEVVLDYAQRRQHTYVIGVNGTGKTTLLRQIAYTDMLQQPKHGLCVIDPHGDLIDDIISLVPEERLDDIILFDPSGEENPFCLNLFAPAPSADEIGRVASEIVAIFRKIFAGAWTPEIEGVIHNATLTLLCRPTDFKLQGKDWVPALDEIPALLAMEMVPEEDREKPPWKRKVTTYRSQFYQLLQEQDQIPVWEFWNYNFDTLTPRPRSELSFAVLNQVRRFLANPTVRNIVAQTESRLSLAEVMNEGKILLVKLSKGLLGEANSAFLGSVIVAKLVVSVFARAALDADLRKPFHIIVDEFQNFAISSFPSLLAEGRKYNVDLVIAHQYRDQLRDWVQGATSNAGNVVCFRLAGDDAANMAREFDSTPPTADEEFEPRYRYATDLTLGCTEAELYILEYDYCLQKLRQLHDGEQSPWKEQNRMRRWMMSWLEIPGSPALAIAEQLRNTCQAPVLTVSKEMLDLLEEWYDALRAERKPAQTYVQERAVYPFNPEDTHRVRNGEIWRQEYVTQTGPIYDRAPGRSRPYSDIYQQIANELTHLPNFHARCKLSRSDGLPLECGFRTIEWPAGYENATEREKRQRCNRVVALANTVRDYTRPKGEVVAEFRARYETMLQSIGMSWSPDEPLPKPQVLYEEDD